MNRQDILEKQFKITVCADGFVSVIQHLKDRRLGSGIPVYGCNDIIRALTLIQKACFLSRCRHRGKTGTTVEPKLVGWPEGGCDDASSEKWLAFAHETFRSVDQ